MHKHIVINSNILNSLIEHQCVENQSGPEFVCDPVDLAPENQVPGNSASDHHAPHKCTPN
jgi:hypothetical protein